MLSKAWMSVIEEFSAYELMNVYISSISYLDDKAHTVWFSVEYKHNGEYYESSHIWEADK